MNTEVPDHGKGQKLKACAMCCGATLGFGGVLVAFLWFAGLLPTLFGGDSSCMAAGKLRFGIEAQAKKDLGWVCCDNERFAEPAGWWEGSSSLRRFMEAAQANSSLPVIFYDAACGLPLFKAPVGRSMGAFLEESSHHGWPSFRLEETFSDNVLSESGGEIVSTCGTHLGHNIPDLRGHRFCINLLCVAGQPPPGADASV